MRKHKKVIFIALAAVLVFGATLGAVAIAQAADQGAAPGPSANVSLFEKVSTIYKANTGTTINAAKLQEAFKQAEQQLATEAQDRMWQKLIADGKVTQKQVDDYKAWLKARPELNTDALKQWLESKPEGIPFGPGMRAPAMNRGFGGFKGMPRGWCAPNATK
jgi:hypothetical protein